MSVAVSRNPRHYVRKGIFGNLQNPPEHTCSAYCLERKFIATRDDVPFVDVEKLSRTIPNRSPFPREFIVSIYKDRLLFQPSLKGPELPDIIYDDIIQLETVPGMRNTMFILTGRQSIGSYQFFKLSDYAMGENIKDLVRKINPEAIMDFDGCGNSMRVCSGRSVPRNRPRGGQFIEYNGMNRDFREKSCPPNFDSNDDISITPLTRQNSFIHWEGYKTSKSKPRTKLVPLFGRDSPINIDRPSSRSSSHSDASVNNNPYEKTIFIQANGSLRRKMSRASNKRRPLVLMAVDKKKRQFTDTAEELEYDNSNIYEIPQREKKKRSRSSNRKIIFPSKDRYLTDISYPTTMKTTKKEGKKTFLINNPAGSKAGSVMSSMRSSSRHGKGYGPIGEDSDISLDFEDVEVGRHRYPNVSKGGRRTKHVEYLQEVVGEDTDGWESQDSWDLPGMKQVQNGMIRGVSFNLPGRGRGGGGPRLGAPYDDNDDLTTSEDSLYLEQEQQFGVMLPKRSVNYLPELENKLRQWTVK